MLLLLGLVAHAAALSAPYGTQCKHCGCPFEGSTFCGRSPVFPFKDCGCPPCPDCKPGRPCVGCDADARCRSCHPPIAKRVRKSLKRTLVALL